MEEGSSFQSGQYRSNGGVMSIGGNNPQDEPSVRQQYSMPGILHFLQTEWARFEMERSQWEVERAELQVFVVLLPVKMQRCSHFLGLLMQSHHCYITCPTRTADFMAAYMLISLIFKPQKSLKLESWGPQVVTLWHQSSALDYEERG